LLTGQLVACIKDGAQVPFPGWEGYDDYNGDISVIMPELKGIRAALVHSDGSYIVVAGGSRDNEWFDSRMSRCERPEGEQSQDVHHAQLQVAGQTYKDINRLFVDGDVYHYRAFALKPVPMEIKFFNGPASSYKEQPHEFCFLVNDGSAAWLVPIPGAVAKVQERILLGGDDDEYKMYSYHWSAARPTYAGWALHNSKPLSKQFCPRYVVPPVIKLHLDLAAVAQGAWEVNRVVAAAKAAGTHTLTLSEYQAYQMRYLVASGIKAVRVARYAGNAVIEMQEVYSTRHLAGYRGVSSASVRELTDYYPEVELSEIVVSKAKRENPEEKPKTTRPAAETGPKGGRATASKSGASRAPRGGAGGPGGGGRATVVAIKGYNASASGAAKGQVEIA
jgi:hypothetical protein